MNLKQELKGKFNNGKTILQAEDLENYAAVVVVYTDLTAEVIGYSQAIKLNINTNNEEPKND